MAAVWRGQTVEANTTKRRGVKVWSKTGHSLVSPPPTLEKHFCSLSNSQGLLDDLDATLVSEVQVHKKPSSIYSFYSMNNFKSHKID